MPAAAIPASPRPLAHRPLAHRPDAVTGRQERKAMTRGSFRLAIFGLGLAAVSAGLAPGAAQDRRPVDLEIVFAADGSGSIDDEEFRLQREGYAAAIASREVLDAIRSGRLRAIAAAYMEWGAPTSQHTIVDWMVISDAASAEAFAERLRTAPRLAFGYNSISAAVDYSAALIHGNAYDGTRKIIDVSGDGPNIGGRPAPEARDDAVAAGIVINALVIASPGGAVVRRGGEALADHYRRDVIGGPGAFIMVVDSRRSIADSIRRKMVLEIAAAEP